MDKRQQLKVLNESAGRYCYVDATAQAEYPYEAVVETIRKGLREEIEFLQIFDWAMDSMKAIVDVPNSRSSLLVRVIFEEYGALSGRRRGCLRSLAMMK